MSPRPKATSDADLLAAAGRVVSQVGPSLTLADVAREAGVSPATLVQRFGSKRGLLLALFSAGPSGEADQFAQIRAAATSALAAVYEVGICMAGMAESPEALSNNLAFLQMDLVDPEFHALALAHSRAMHAEIVKLLDEAVTARELEKCDTGALARAIQSLIGGALVQWAIDRDTTAAERVRDDLTTLLRGRRVATRVRKRRHRRKNARS